MKMPGQVWRHRRFVILCLGLWLLAELVSGPAPYPWILVNLAVGLAAILSIAGVLPALRYVFISFLIALIPVRMLGDSLQAAIGWIAPDAGTGWFWLVSLIAVVVLSRLVVLLGLLFDQLALRRPWFVEASTVIARPRRQVWHALCLTDASNHWDPSVQSILQDLRFPSRYIIHFEGGPSRLVLREVEREEEIFQEMETEADPGFCHGLGPVISVLLEDVPRGTRVTMGMELHNASLLRLGRFFIDADLTWYVQTFTRAMSARPRRPLISGPRLVPLPGSERRPAAIHG